MDRQKWGAGRLSDSGHGWHITSDQRVSDVGVGDEEWAAATASNKREADRGGAFDRLWLVVPGMP
jgi:hypothetical protein